MSVRYQSLLRYVAFGILLSTGGCGLFDAPETCTDGIQNQNETGVDCGGVCNACETCDDGIKNQDETATDCGGVCAPCTAEMLKRDSVIAEYNTVYLQTEVTDTGWTGNTASCTAGTVSQDTHNKVIARINYFRKLVGLNDNTTLDASFFDQMQQTVLMMHANGTIDHFPPNTWACWTQSGYDGAGITNLATTHSTAAVTLFIEDPGSFNHAVGHRRWILHSDKTQFSYGTTSQYMALTITGVAGGNTKIPDFIAYPPGTYVPQQLVFPKWSFSIPSADFTSANVAMTGPDGNVTLTIISRTDNGYGDNTIVWEPQGIVTNSPSDVEYTVTVTGVLNAAQADYTYKTTIVDPGN